MREKKPYQVLTFHTTDAAMEMESFCKQNGIVGAGAAQTVRRMRHRVVRRGGSLGAIPCVYRTQRH